MIYIFYTDIQGLGLHLIMFSSMVLCDKPNFAHPSDEGACFCDMGCYSLPTGMANFLFNGNKHEWKWEDDKFWALFNIYPGGS